MPRPSVLAGGHSAGLDVVVELGVLAQAAPKAVLLAGVVGLVDEVALVGVGVVLLDEGLGCAVPGLRLESAAVAQAERDGLAEGAEEGGLELRVPGEAGAAVLARTRGPASAAGDREVLVGHGWRWSAGAGSGVSAWPRSCAMRVVGAIGASVPPVRCGRRGVDDGVASGLGRAEGCETEAIRALRRRVDHCSWLWLCGWTPDHRDLRA